MIDQLIIGDKASFDDYGASLTKRKIGMPVKKKIKETVPFSNITYDFSAINGEVYWEERSLEYIFEIIAENAEKLEELKLKFAAWVMSVQGERLQDPFIPDYHFNATYDDMSFEDEDGLEKTTVTVKFTAYPYMIANNAKVYEKVIAPSNVLETLLIVNESAHPVTMTVTNDKHISIAGHDGLSELEAGTHTHVRIGTGVCLVNVRNKTIEPCNVRISFYEEVF